MASFRRSFSPACWIKSASWPSKIHLPFTAPFFDAGQATGPLPASFFIICSVEIFGMVRFDSKGICYKNIFFQQKIPLQNYTVPMSYELAWYNVRFLYRGHLFLSLLSFCECRVNVYLTCKIHNIAPCCAVFLLEPKIPSHPQSLSSCPSLFRPVSVLSLFYNTNIPLWCRGCVMSVAVTGGALTAAGLFFFYLCIKKGRNEKKSDEKRERR